MLNFVWLKNAVSQEANSCWDYANDSIQRYSVHSALGLRTFTSLWESICETTVGHLADCINLIRHAQPIASLPPIAEPLSTCFRPESAVHSCDIRCFLKGHLKTFVNPEDVLRQAQCGCRCGVIKGFQDSSSLAASILALVVLVYKLKISTGQIFANTHLAESMTAGARHRSYAALCDLNDVKAVPNPFKMLRRLSTRQSRRAGRNLIFISISTMQPACRIKRTAKFVGFMHMSRPLYIHVVILSDPTCQSSKPGLRQLFSEIAPLMPRRPLVAELLELPTGLRLKSDTIGSCFVKLACYRTYICMTVTESSILATIVTT